MINTVGTAEAPVVVLGIPDAGRRPVITGEGAVTRLELSYWNENRSVIKIGGSNLPSDDIVPAHVTLQSLDIRSGRPAYAFIDDAGGAGTYAQNAAAVHVEIGTDITIHDCLLHDCGNGLFVSSPASRITTLAGWPEELNDLANQIYADFNKEHGTDFRFQLKR